MRAQSLRWEDSLEDHVNSLQYSCLENLMDRGGWWVIVHGVSKSQTRLKGLNMPACIFVKKALDSLGELPSCHMRYRVWNPESCHCIFLQIVKLSFCVLSHLHGRHDSFPTIVPGFFPFQEAGRPPVSAPWQSWGRANVWVAVSPPGLADPDGLCCNAHAADRKSMDSVPPLVKVILQSESISLCVSKKLLFC